MNILSIETRGNQTQFAPGEIVNGSATWQLQRSVELVELRLVWFTRGKGTVDVSVVDSMRFENPQMRETRPFHLQLPHGPYSFSGKLISLLWALELVAPPIKEVARLDFTLSPTGSEIVLPSPATADVMSTLLKFSSRTR